MDRKLQVFVSSTYKDMNEERQAAVEAILEAMHIPAGMELFTASNKSQLETIYKWIDDSDIFCLILGGRYGSIDKDSGKSYIELEYDFAVKMKKPCFTLVIHEDYLDEKVKKMGREVIESLNGQLLKKFKDKVQNKMCNFFTSLDSLKLIITKSLNEIAKKKSLVGWVKSDNIDFDLYSAKKLEIENKKLKKELSLLQLFPNQGLKLKSSDILENQFPHYVYKYESISEIYAVRKNEVKIPAYFLHQNKGSLSFWVFITDKFLNSKKNKHLFSHCNNEGRLAPFIGIEPGLNEYGEIEYERKYLNLFTIRHSNKKNQENSKGIFTFMVSDNFGNTSQIYTEKPIKTGWHMFCIGWSKDEGEAKFYIDSDCIGQIKLSNWPKEVCKNCFLGTWPNLNEAYYINTSCGNLFIFNDKLDHNDVNTLYNFSRPKVMFRLTPVDKPASVNLP
jgi:hypothetical protein